MRTNETATNSRRKFLRYALGGGAALVGGRVLLSLFFERNWLTVYRVTVSLPSLPPALNGFTICQLSDLHRGPVVSEEHIRRAAEIAMSLNADLIAVTGDFVSGEAANALSCAAALAGLRARYGVYGVLGNHDYWTQDVEAVADAVTRGGVQLLTNRAVRLNVHGVHWWLCGVDDVWAGEPNLDAALQYVPDGAFRILLCHEPDFADESAKRNIPLQISGHSHGGQVRLPLIGGFVLPPYGRKYPMGLQRVPNSSTLVYTNVGVGTIIPPIRMNCRPEVTLMTLVAVK